MATPRMGAVMETIAKEATTRSLGAPRTSTRYDVTQNWMPVTTKKSAASAKHVNMYVGLCSSFLAAFFVLISLAGAPLPVADRSPL